MPGAQLPRSGHEVNPRASGVPENPGACEVEFAPPTRPTRDVTTGVFADPPQIAGHRRAMPQALFGLLPWVSVVSPKGGSLKFQFEEKYNVQCQ